MRPELQQKIRKYREKKNIQSTFEKSIDKNRTKLKQYTKQINGGSSRPQSNIDQFLKMNENRFLQYTKQLIETKNKQTELTHKLEDIKTEMFFEEKKKEELKRNLEEEERRYEYMINQKMDKFETEKHEKLKMYEQRIQKNIGRIQELLSEKEQHNTKSTQFILKKKKFQETKIKMKEAHEVQMKMSKQRFLQQENSRRKNWQTQKSQQLQARTLKNLQPEIQRIVQSGKNEINTIKQMYEKEISQFRKATDQTYQQALSKFNKEQSLKLQRERQQILAEYAQKNKQQIQKKEEEFEDERNRARNDYEKEIRNLEHDRNRESEEFLRKGKYFYMENLTEIRSIREDYEKEVKELDGKVEVQVQARQKQLAPKLTEKIQALKESSKQKLLKLIQNYDRQKQKQIADNLQILCNQIAIQNAAYQRKVSRDTQNKIKQEKQNSQLEIKQLRKTINALQKKLQLIQGKRKTQKNQRDQYETEYLQAKSNNQFLIRKLHQLTNDAEDLKVEESSVELRKQERKEEIGKMWDKQIESIKESLKAVQNENSMVESVMKDQQVKLKEETEQIIREIQMNAQKICEKKRKQAGRLIIKIEQMEKLHDTLQGLIKKQEQFYKKQKANK